MVEKRGQVAMEFLMTYGWAILIILIAVGALWMLGVFSPKVSTNCSIDAPFSCQDINIEGDSVNLKIATGKGFNGEINNVEVDGQSCNLLVNELKSAKPTYTECTGLNLEEGGEVTGTIDISYTRPGGFTHPIEGTFSGEVIKENLVTAGEFETIEFVEGPEGPWGPGTSRLTQEEDIAEFQISPVNSEMGALYYIRNLNIDTNKYDTMEIRYRVNSPTSNCFDFTIVVYDGAWKIVHPWNNPPEEWTEWKGDLKAITGGTTITQIQIGLSDRARCTGTFQTDVDYIRVYSS